MTDPGAYLAFSLGAILFILQVSIRITKGYIMSAKDAAVAEVTEQLAAARDRIVAKLSDLETQVAAGDVDDSTLQALQNVADALDAVVPAVPVEVPPAEAVPAADDVIA